MVKRQILVGSLILLFVQSFAPAATYYVPSRDLLTIQDGINAAGTGDVVIVAPGTYTGFGNVDLDFGGTNITVRSEDPNDPAIVAATIIDCAGDKYNPHRAFWFHNGENNSSKVLGFTIINGYARGSKGADASIPGTIVDPNITDPTDHEFWFVDANSGANATGNGYGGAILCDGASPTIKYCVISDSIVTGAQGGDGGNGQWGPWVGADPCDATPYDNGQPGGGGGHGGGNGYGGAIACINSSSPIIDNCIIKDNLASGGRGGDGGDGGEGTFDGSSYTGNESSGANAGDSNGDGIGGGIYADGTSSPVVIGCDFSNNAASTGIRAAGGQRGIGTETNPRAWDGIDGFVYAAGGIAGGAGYYASTSTADFNDCTFTSNKAYEAGTFPPSYYWEETMTYTVGGALYSGGNGTVNIYDCNFTGNLGGAVYIGDHSNVIQISNSSFFGNSDPNDGSDLFIDSGIDFGSGGALFIDYGAAGVSLQGCTFGGNSAKNDGGALKSRSNATLTDCAFGGNIAENGYGGAIDAYYSGTTLTLNFNDCSFSSNQSWRGGAFSSENFTGLTFTDCYFLGNTAERGGALDLANGDFSITGGTIKANQATGDHGGGINSRYSSALINDCTISNNIADGTGSSGGAINFYGAASPQLVKNCLIVNNYAGNNGGAISCFNAAPDINNSTFSGNSAAGFGGAVFANYLSHPKITDCIFQNSDSHAIHEADGGGDATAKFNLFLENPDGDYYDSGTASVHTGAAAINGLAGNSNNYDDSGFPMGELLFKSGPLGGFYLNQSLAPPIDSGSDTAANLGLNTYTTRTDSVGDADQVDVGYHYIDIAGASQYILTIVQPANGTIEAEPDPVDPNGYYAGTVVTLTAISTSGWRVKKWSGTDDDASKELTNTVVMHAAREVTVEFELPKTLTVGIDGDYTTIEAAITAAVDGDTIVVSPGTWYGPEIIINKSITIRSVDPNNPELTIIDRTDYVDRAFFFGPDTDSGTVLNGFTIQNCRWQPGQMDDPDPCPGLNGIDGPGVSGAAIYISSGASPVIKNSIIRNNWIRGGDASGGCDADETHNAGRGGWGGWAKGGAIYCGQNSSPTFINCRIIDNFAGGGNGGDGGNEADDGGWPNYGGNWSADGNPGVPAIDIHPEDLSVDFIYDDSLWNVWGYIGDYRWYTAYGGGVYCDVNSNVIFIDSTISGNRTEGGMSGEGGEWVSGTDDQEPEISYWLPSFGGGVYCAAGSTVTFTGSTIEDNTAVRPDANETANYHLDPYLGHGGGVAAEDTATVTFIDCNFSGNEAAVGGGLYFSDANAQIIDCNFTSNSAYDGGGLLGIKGTATIIGSVFTGNEAFGDVTNPSGEENDPDTYDPNNNYYLAGYGGGIHSDTLLAEIIDSTIRSNTAGAGGGGVYFQGENFPSLDNCLITKNRAGSFGGGVSAYLYSQLSISNCTIADNVVTGNGYGGGLYSSYGSYSDVIDSIIWGNLAAKGSQLAITGGSEYSPEPSGVDVSYSNIGPNTIPVAFDSSSGSGTGSGATLIEGQTIYDQFDAGQEKVKVIVTLVETARMRALSESVRTKAMSMGVRMREQAKVKSLESARRSLRAEIAACQQSVLASLTAAEFGLRHRFENFAGFSCEVTASCLEKLLANPSVASVEPVRILYPHLAQGIPLMNATAVRSSYNGEGMAIAICDTGVDYTHPRLGGGGFPNSKVIGGYDTGDNDSDPMPNSNEGAAHGTSAAGIAAGDLDTVGDYIGGVAYNAKIYAIKMTSDSDPDNSATSDAMIAAWDWCVTHQYDDANNPIMVINTSFGGDRFFSPEEADSYSPAMTAAADSAVAAGITVLASSGNEFYTNSIAWPAAISSVISVGAVDDVQDTVMDYSNTASFLDILAPSDCAHTTDIAGIDGYSTDDYTTCFNGTSAACPYAAGAVAALQSAAVELGSYLTPEQVRTLLATTGDPITDTKVAITKPRVNLGLAIYSLVPPDPIYVEQNSTLTGWDFDTDANQWEPNSISGNIQADPCFVDSYYLSQIDAGQDADSPSVDAGSDLAVTLGLNLYTTRTDRIFDKGVVDMGYHQPFAKAELCKVCDFVQDGVINSNDYAVFALHWGDVGCSDDNNWCGGADFTFDSVVDFDDLVYLVECWLVGDTGAPIPDPAQWQTEPYTVSSEPPVIGMKAKTAVDGWAGGVEYYFECVTDGNFTSGWQSDPNYISGGLALDTEYGYRVRTRDLLDNETDWSVVRSATVTILDTTSPIPDPMTWAVVPEAVDSNSITMTATTATDPEGSAVEYYFDETTGNPGATDSGWQGSSTYTDDGLDPNTTYTYTVKARDASGNETGVSSSESATTLLEGAATDTTPPEPAPTIVSYSQYYDGSYYRHSMESSTATDDGSPPVEYYFQCDYSSGFDSGWQTGNTWDVAVGAYPKQWYWRVKARDQQGNETGYSAWVLVQ